MSRRLEIELTSERPDGTWTWRAAGARQPKGELRASVLFDGASVGDVVRAEADFALDGIEILSVLPPKAKRAEPQRVEVVGTRSDEPLVTTQLAAKGRGGGKRDRGDRGNRGDRRERGERPDRGERSGRGDRPRGPRPDPVPERPKPKRLRPGRTHRTAVLDEVPAEHRPIAEQVLRGGIPAVREAIAKQNEQARAENRPEVPDAQLVALAEQLLPQLRAAEWRDRAEAAVRDLDELDLRDLRSVVVAADGTARGDEALALLEQLRSGLARRVEEEQQVWIDDMTANLDAGRFVRALRLSSRPPKAGTPLPPELATRLIAAVSEGLTPTVNQDLWAAALDALAFSPVRTKVVPAGRPETPSDALLDAARRVASRIPVVVELFGLDPAEVAAAEKRRGRGGRARGGAKKGKQTPRPPKDERAGRPAGGEGGPESPDPSSVPPGAVEVPVVGEAGPDAVAVTPEAEIAVAGDLDAEASTEATEAPPEATERTDAPAEAPDGADEPTDPEGADRSSGSAVEVE